MRKLILKAAVAALFAIPSIAEAATCASGGLSDTSPASLACYSDSGNDLGNGHLADQETALRAIGGLGQNQTISWDSVDTVSSLANGNQLVFRDDNNQPITLSGIVYIAIHFGNSNTNGNTTEFYKIDTGTGVSAITLNNTQGFSVAGYYSTLSTPSSPGAVPEPATWAMMLLGFGAIGFALRRKPGSTYYA